MNPGLGRRRHATGSEKEPNNLLAQLFPSRNVQGQHERVFSCNNNNEKLERPPTMFSAGLGKEMELEDFSGCSGLEQHRGLASQYFSSHSEQYNCVVLDNRRKGRKPMG